MVRTVCWRKKFLTVPLSPWWSGAMSLNRASRFAGCMLKSTSSGLMVTKRQAAGCSPFGKYPWQPYSIACTREYSVMRLPFT